MIIFAKVCISIHYNDFITQNVQPAHILGAAQRHRVPFPIPFPPSADRISEQGVEDEQQEEGDAGIEVAILHGEHVSERDGQHQEGVPEGFAGLNVVAPPEGKTHLQSNDRVGRVSYAYYLAYTDRAALRICKDKDNFSNESTNSQNFFVKICVHLLTPTLHCEQFS